MESSTFKARPWCIGMAMALLASFSSPSAHAADGCKFLLCMAGQWNSIAECRPTVHQVLRDLAHGRPLPAYQMGGAGTSADNLWVDEATCPSMYRQKIGDVYMGCHYPARISVYIHGSLWSQVFWDMGGSTSTWYSPQARASLAPQAALLPLDEQFLHDLSRWNTTTAPQVAQCQAMMGAVLVDPFGAFARCNVPIPESGGG